MEIIGRIVEQIESVITQVYDAKNQNSLIHPNLRRTIFSFTYTFRLTYFFTVYI